MSTPPGSPITLEHLGEVVTITLFTVPPASPPSPDSEAMPPPPGAPRKRRIRRSAPYWQNLRHQCRRRFQRYTPEDIREIDDIHTLERLFKMYFFKHSKPASMAEWLYCSAMINSLCEKLK